jgi:putative DNA primase/helicase
LNDATNGDAELIRYLQQIAGYVLTGATSEHVLFFIYGLGGNGKTVFLNTLTAILSEYAQTAAMDTFTASKYDRHPTDLAMLKGARLVTASETEEGRKWAEAKIKQMTGGDPITARFMRRDYFTYQPEFKLVIIGNHKPCLDNVDDAMRRRLNIIPFTNKPSTPDPDLESKLREEWPAILRWMIEGCLDWQQNGFLRPNVVSDATSSYFEDQDLLGQWLNECCEPRANYKESPLARSNQRDITPLAVR